MTNTNQIFDIAQITKPSFFRRAISWVKKAADAVAFALTVPSNPRLAGANRWF